MIKMDDKELQSLLDDTATRLRVVGAQMAIYIGGEQREFTTGYRNLELKLPVTPDTLFQIGSTTKVFNAVLVMMLVDTGKVALDAPIQEYLADFRLADSEAARTITLRHLLSMTAGLDNGTYYDHGRGNDALGRYVEALSAIPHIFAPGSGFGYSNASTNVAGHALARVTGQPWEQLLMERVFAPLGLTQCELFAEDLLRHPLALGYVVSEARVERARAWSYPRSIAPAGGLTCSSAGDLVRLARLFLSHGRSIAGLQVLSPDAVRTMQEPQIKLPTRLYADEWCVGPYRKRWGGYELHGHSGTNLGGSSMLLWCPEKNVAIATVVNVANQGYPLADAVFDVVFPRIFGIDKPATLTPANATPISADLAPYAGRFEAFGMRYSFAVEDGRLMLSAVAPEMGLIAATKCELIPLGEDRFLPSDPRISGNRNWDIAFWGRDINGRPSNLAQGVFPLRRTG
jgi:CubicO group peptidase (beta-lactamase class C family)